MIFSFLQPRSNFLRWRGALFPLTLALFGFVTAVLWPYEPVFAQGFILIDKTLQSISHPNIFATGDIAAMVNHPRPKAGVFAVRQGKPLFENLRCITSEKPLQPFRPQKHHLALIGLGDRQAIVAWGSLCIGPSSLLWFWKDWIGRRFMVQFKTLPGVILQNLQNAIDPRKSPSG